MSEMVERVGLAVRKAIEDVADLDDSMHEIIGRAAITAMREPTEAQYNALCATGKLWRELNSYEVWTTYIDEELK